MKIPNELFINGQWCGASDGVRMDVIDPATEATIDTVPVATTVDLDRALDAAQAGWKSWREVDAWSRSRVLRRIAELLRERIDQIAEALTAEQGKPLAEARGELGASADQFDWYADEARRIYGRVIDGHSREHRLMVIRQSIGPVVAFSPWNFPALLSARKMAPALATGCSIIVKPAEETPRTTMLLAQACADAGVPPGVVNVVTGDPAMISGHLLASDIIRKVSFTGSAPIGREIMRLCSDAIKPVTLELGGHSPVLVFPDADVEETAEICAKGKFRNNGQVCIAASRFYVHQDVAEAFTEKFVQVAQALHIGNGREEGVEVGPLSNRRRLDATCALVADAIEKGATLKSGGKAPAEFKRGFFFMPTVLSNVDPSMRIMTEEPFCPVAPITTFNTLDEVLEKANQTPYGLAGYVFTKDMRTAFLAAEGLEAGMVGVNNLVIATAEIPFGGIKLSGFGREGGSEGIESYTVAKYINFRL